MEQNIELGVLGLKIGLEQFDGDWKKTLAAYNQGATAAAKLNDDLNVPDSQKNVPKTNAGVKALNDAQKQSLKAQRYVNTINQYFTKRQPGFVMPKASIWTHLSPEKKKEYRQRVQKMIRNAE